jgi:hypothetical protein
MKARLLLEKFGAGAPIWWNSRPMVRQVTLKD